MSRAFLPALALLLPLTALSGAADATRRAPSLPDVSTGLPTLGDVDISEARPSITGMQGHGAQGQSNAKSPVEARQMGVAWLKQVQGKDGGWGSGAWGNNSLGVPSDVATTSVTVLALMRDGQGVAKHRQAITQGVGFVLAAVDHAPRNSPLLRTPTGTQPQHKLGPNVDTHLAGLMLGELSGKMDAETNRAILVALDTVVGKIAMASDGNGRFESTGWAPVLSTSVAASALDKAEDLGVAVAPELLRDADDYQQGNVGTGGAVAAADGAGVELYAMAGAMRQSTTSARKRGNTEMADSKQAMEGRIAGQTDAIIAGFGSIGGEEMLSYMMISDSLAEEGGKQWDNWDQRIGSYLMQIQNADGSWAGHHCITSIPFVTATAVMTLGAENHQAMQSGSLGMAPIRPDEPADVAATRALLGGIGVRALD